MRVGENMEELKRLRGAARDVQCDEQRNCLVITSEEKDAEIARLKERIRRIEESEFGI